MKSINLTTKSSTLPKYSVPFHLPFIKTCSMTTSYLSTYFLMALVVLVVLPQQPLFFKKVHASSINAQMKPLPATTDIQTGWVNSMQLQSNGETLLSTTITYKNQPKSSVPGDRHIIIGLDQIDYKTYKQSSRYQFRQDISYQDSTLTGIVFRVNHKSSGDLYQASIRYFIIDPQSRYLNYIQLELVKFDDNFDTNQQISFIHTDAENSAQAQQNYAVATFLKHCIIRGNTTFGVLGLRLTYNWNKNSLGLRVQDANGYFTSLNYRVMIMYKNKFPKKGYRYDFIVGTFRDSNVLNPWDKVSQEQTHMIIGLRQTLFAYSNYRIYFFISYNENEEGFEFKNIHGNINHIVYQIIGFNQYGYGCFDKDYLFFFGGQCYKEECPQNTYPSLLELPTEGYQYFCRYCYVRDYVPECLQCTHQKKCSKCMDHYSLEERQSQDYQVGCKIDTGYFKVSLTTHIAHSCSSANLGCIECYVTTYDSNNNSENIKCFNCENNYFLDSNQLCQTCENVAQNCILCNASSCFGCKNGYTLVGQRICRETNQLEQALQDFKVSPFEPVIPECQDSQNCKQCNLNNVKMCYRCFDSAKTLVYFKGQNSSECQTICGDSKIVEFVQECDDGNNRNHDGCSSSCKLQGNSQPVVNRYFECTNTSYQYWYKNQTFIRTDCRFVGKIKLTFLSLEKVTDQNRLQGKLSLSHPIIGAWSVYLERDLTELMSLKLKGQDSQKNKGIAYQFKASFRFTGKTDSSAHSQDQKERRLLQQTADQQVQRSGLLANFSIIHFDIEYSEGSEPYESLNHQTLSLSFDPSQSGLQIFSVAQPAQLAFDLITDNNQIIQHHDQSYYYLYIVVKISGFFVSMSCLVMLLVGLVSSSAFEKGSFSILIALEYSAIVQLTLFSLGVSGELNTLFVGLTESLLFVGGSILSFELFENIERPPLNRDLKSIGYKSSNFANNSIVPILLILAVTLISIVLKVIAKILKPQKKEKLQNVPIAADIMNTNTQQQNPQQRNYDLNLANQTQQIQPETQEVAFSTKLQNAGNILLGSIGLPLLIYFSYGIFLSTAMQLNSISSLNQLKTMDITLMGTIMVLILVYILLIILKIQIFQVFVFKIRSSNFSHENEVENANSELSRRSRCNKRYYLLSTVLERVTNSYSLYFLGAAYPSFSAAVPILTYTVLLIIALKVNFVAQAHKLRFYGNLLTGLAIQCCLLCRGLFSYFQNPSINQKGYVQNPIGQHIALTIVVILVIMCLINIAFFVYSIKRLRCCQLEMKWNNEPTNSTRRNETLCNLPIIQNFEENSGNNQVRATLDTRLNSHKKSKSQNQDNKKQISPECDSDSKSKAPSDYYENFWYRPKPPMKPIQKQSEQSAKKPDYHQFQKQIKRKIEKQSSIIKNKKIENNSKVDISLTIKKIQKSKKKTKAKLQESGIQEKKKKQSSKLQQHQEGKQNLPTETILNKLNNCQTNIDENPWNLAVSTYRYTDPNNYFLTDEYNKI